MNRQQLRERKQEKDYPVAPGGPPAQGEGWAYWPEQDHPQEEGPPARGLGDSMLRERLLSADWVAPEHRSAAEFDSISILSAGRLAPVFLF